MTEIWLPVKDFPGYEISDTAEVKSLQRTVMQNGHPKRLQERILRPCADTHSGLKKVTLYKEGRGYCRYVHALAREAFGEEHF